VNADLEFEPAALIGHAREVGEPDTYAGKREWTRYRIGVRVEATTDPTRANASWHVNVHDVSGGGVGFWSKQKLPIASTVWVRDCFEDSETTWLKGRVCHCSVGMRGHLIGIAFDQPTPTDSHEPPPMRHVEPIDEESLPIRVSGRLVSLQTKCIYATVIAVSTAIAFSFLMAQGFVPGLSEEASGIVAIAAALITGTFCGWWIARNDAIFLNELHMAIRGMAAGKLDSCRVIEAPCAELATIGRAFNDLWTRWKQREYGERMQRQKLEELGQIKNNILSIVSHDLRTPLTSILMYTNMLMDGGSEFSADEQKGFLGIINEECHRLARLVEDILEVQRLESDAIRIELTPCDLAPTIAGCVPVFEPLADNKSMTLSIDCPETLPTVMADADRISQVINNLVANALKYTPAGGAVQIAAHQRDKELLISVHDNGPGIPRDKWDHIFDRFSQVMDPDVSEVAGVGLGLYIVARIVESHGGTVWVDSKVGEGTAFFVALPLEGEPLLIPSSPAETALHATCKIIACDSDPELLATVVHTLRANGFDVRAAHTGQRLLQHLEQGDVDVVVTDILVPDMHAVDLLDALNGLSHRSFRTIIHSYEGDAEGYGRRGVDVFLRRPVSRQELVEAVHVVLRRRAAAGRVVIVQNHEIDTERLSRMLVEAGHAVMVAGSIGEASVLAHKYGADVNVVSGETVADDRVGLINMMRKLSEDTALVVLSTPQHGVDTDLGERFGAVVVPYTYGREEDVVDVIRKERSRAVTEKS